MELALIPPKGLEQYIHLSTFQLPLAQIHDEAYFRAYAVAKKRGDFLVMDNGIAEGVYLTTAQILVAANRYAADEVVLPDFPDNPEKTYGAVKASLYEMTRLPMTYTRGKQFMAVVQGPQMDKCKTLIDQLATEPKILTLGIPRRLITVANPAIRIDLANWIHSEYPERFNIHFLGTSPFWPKEVRSVARYAPHVRSLDTSMPFNYALNQIRLDSKDLPVIPCPEGYFETDHWDSKLIGHNVRVALEWIHAEAPVS